MIGTAEPSLTRARVTFAGCHGYLPVDARSATQSFELYVEEQNLAGTQQTLGAHVGVGSFTNTYGGRYEVPRLAGSFLTVKSAADVFVNRETGQMEGSHGGCEVIVPFRTNRSPWSAFASFVWDARRVRVAGEEWSARGLATAAALTRSWGWRTKNDLSWVFVGTRAAYESGEPRPTSMPLSNSRLGGGLEWHGYTSNFLRTHDPAQPMEHRLLSLYVAAQETLPLGDGLVRASVAAQRDYGADEVRDSWIKAHLDITTPRTGFGRVVGDVETWYRHDNWLSTTYRSTPGCSRVRASAYGS